ncbi:hypothetical protein SAMN05444004_101232 [Jannaschia faecimaris]|uniref:Uncharacterized protein n=1 Tax=Jannaschia faecimaris TaxID=1244108 RepID=A0A1H3J7Q6_9RHOB|nr:hypothetical protein [Jannaschia faecimaris]SDY35952.1 hypothetical protein SAMN05444004_101232 [Jannaschia faecimaris]
MDDFKKTNRAGRGIAMFFATVGWGIAAVGLLLAVAGAMLGAVPGSGGASDPVTITNRLGGAGPGIGIALFGLFSVLMAVQTRAALDTADMTRAMLAAARRGSPVATAAAPAAQPSNSITGKPIIRTPEGVDDSPPIPADLRPRMDAPVPAASAGAVAPVKSPSRPEPMLKAMPRPAVSRKTTDSPKPHPIFSAKPPR